VITDTPPVDFTDARNGNGSNASKPQIDVRGGTSRRILSVLRQVVRPDDLY